MMWLSKYSENYLRPKKRLVTILLTGIVLESCNNIKVNLIVSLQAISSKLAYMAYWLSHSNAHFQIPSKQEQRDSRKGRKEDKTNVCRESL